ncbi:MAG TPA: DUF3313 domain-containing protein [Candidatus Binatia bacterium]|jgi:hypothetical protein
MLPTRNRWQLVAATVLAATVLVGSSGCSGVRARRQPPAPSGFLGDYSRLEKSPANDFLQVYITPGVNWSDYHAIHLDSVTLWASSPSQAKLSDADQQLLTDILYKALYDALSERFLMAEEPGPQTIQVRAALTQAKGANVPLNTITTVVPQLRILTTLGGLAADTAVLVGSASIEIEGRDEISDRLLMAAVDARAGQKSLTTMMSKWADVEAAANLWGKRVAEFFARQGVQRKG